MINERDELGSDLVPDYLTSVPDDNFFGRPYNYYDQHLDERVRIQRPDLGAKARVPDFAEPLRITGIIKKTMKITTRSRGCSV